LIFKENEFTEKMLHQLLTDISGDLRIFSIVQYWSFGFILTFFTPNCLQILNIIVIFVIL